jgi:hypothetical protein
MSQTGLRRRFGAQLVTKLTIFGAAIFALRPGKPRTASNALQTPPGYTPGLLTAQKL